MKKNLCCGDVNGWVALEVLDSLFYCYTWESLLALSKLAVPLQESLEVNWQLINMNPGLVLSIRDWSCVVFFSGCSNLPPHLSSSCNNSQPKKGREKEKKKNQST